MQDAVTCAADRRDISDLNALGYHIKTSVSQSFFELRAQLPTKKNGLASPSTFLKSTKTNML